MIEDTLDLKGALGERLVSGVRGGSEVKVAGTVPVQGDAAVVLVEGIRIARAINSRPRLFRSPPTAEGAPLAGPSGSLADVDRHVSQVAESCGKAISVDEELQELMNKTGVAAKIAVLWWVAVVMDVTSTRQEGDSYSRIVIVFNALTNSALVIIGGAICRWVRQGLNAEGVLITAVRNGSYPWVDVDPSGGALDQLATLLQKNTTWSDYFIACLTPGRRQGRDSTPVGTGGGTWDGLRTGGAVLDIAMVIGALYMMVAIKGSACYTNADPFTLMNFARIVVRPLVQTLPFVTAQARTYDMASSIAWLVLLTRQLTFPGKTRPSECAQGIADYLRGPWQNTQAAGEDNLPRCRR